MQQQAGVSVPHLSKKKNLKIQPKKKIKPPCEPPLLITNHCPCKVTQKNEVYTEASGCVKDMLRQLRSSLGAPRDVKCELHRGDGEEDIHAQTVRVI